MNDLEVGDEVRCVDANRKDLYDKHLVEGNTYTIEDFDCVGDFMLVEIDEDIGALSSRFEKVEDQEFEVGDRVRVVECDFTNEYGSIVSIGKTGEIVDIRIFNWHSYDTETSIEVDFDEGSYNQFVPNALELISKGSEETMEDVDAIAVEVFDKDTKDYLSKIAKKNGYEWQNGSALNPLNRGRVYRFYGGNKISTMCKVRDNYDSNKHNFDKLYKTPDDLSKVVEFLEQEDETFEINGHEVEVGDPEFSIGCYEATQETLRHFVKNSELLNLSDDSILKVQAEEVTLSQAKELLEWLESQQ